MFLFTPSHDPQWELLPWEGICRNVHHPRIVKSLIFNFTCGTFVYLYIIFIFSVICATSFHYLWFSSTSLIFIEGLFKLYHLFYSVSEWCCWVCGEWQSVVQSMMGIFQMAVAQVMFVMSLVRVEQIYMWTQLFGDASQLHLIYFHDANRVNVDRWCTWCIKLNTLRLSYYILLLLILINRPTLPPLHPVLTYVSA